MIVLPYPPSVNRYWRHVVVKNVPRVYVTREGTSYKHTVGMACAAAGLKPNKGAVRLTIHVYRPRRIGDLDNSLKSLLDAVKGFAYEDDSQVVEIHAFRFDDAKRPRVELWIDPAYDASPGEMT